MKRKEIFRLMFPAAAFAGMVLLASCSADELNSGGGSTIVPPSGETVSSGTVNFTNNTSMTIGNGSITEGTTRTAWMTRGASFDFDGNEACKLEMPAEPTIPEDRFDLSSTITECSYNNVVVADGKTLTFVNIVHPENTLSFTGTVYVESGGKVVINQACTGGGSIFVLSGGTLEYNIETLSDVKIYNYGGTVTLNGDLTIDSDAEFATTTDLDMQDNSLTVSGGKLYVGKNLKCGSITSETGGTLIHVLGAVSTSDNVTIDGDIDMCVEGAMTVRKYNAPSVQISNTANVHIDCKLEVIDEDVKNNEALVNVTDGATLCVSYLVSRRLNVSGGEYGRVTNIYLPNQGVIDVYSLAVGTSTMTQLYGSEGNALVKADEISFDGGSHLWGDVFDTEKLYFNYSNIWCEDSQKPTDTAMHNVVTINSDNAGECSPGFTIDEPEDPDTPTGESEIVVPIPTDILKEYTLKADDFAIRINGEYQEDIVPVDDEVTFGNIKITDDGLNITVSGLSYDEILDGNDYTYEVWLWIDNRQLDTENGTGGYIPLFDTNKYLEWIGLDPDTTELPVDYESPDYESGVDMTKGLSDKDLVKSPAGYVVRYNVYRGLSGHIDKDTGLGDTPYIKVSIHVQKDVTAPENTNVGVWPKKYNE